jgi:hypothetical protein
MEYIRRAFRLRLSTETAIKEVMTTPNTTVNINGSDILDGLSIPSMNLRVIGASLEDSVVPLEDKLGSLF